MSRLFVVLSAKRLRSVTAAGAGSNVFVIDGAPGLRRAISDVFAFTA